MFGKKRRGLSFMLIGLLVFGAMFQGIGMKAVQAEKVDVKTVADIQPTFIKPPILPIPLFQWPNNAALEVTKITSTEATLTWPTPGGILKLSRYIIYVNDTFHESIAADRNTFTVKNLTQGTAYKFSIVAFAGQTSLAPLTVDARTPGILIPIKWPDNGVLAVSDVTETSLKLAWPKPEGISNISGFRVFIDGKLQHTAGEDAEGATFTGLQPSTNYTFAVEAFTTAGLGFKTALLSIDAKTKVPIPIEPDPDPVDPEPDPVVPDPVDPDPIKPDPVDPIDPDPIKPDPVDPINPGPVNPIDPIINLTDIANHWAREQIKEGVTRKIVNGYGDHTFRPDNKVNRAEFAIIIANALSLKGEGVVLNFVDNRKIGASSRKAIAQAVEAGIISGFHDGTFRPDAEITRLEMAAIIARAMELPMDPTAHTGFADDGSIPAWARGEVGALQKTGVIQGRSGNKFDPRANATRAETIVMLLRMLDY
ncbi:S-layer homology domain-containing protein [Sporosarcina sp. G11-34]|uniref:S-layer homology domain-containing protein n=1 Tax=Sporosarcina sp. G11-34 TaxID=2849605 RepID=UPI0022A9E6EA|nr:S-layer homology domain-containing protein [Sporosarcina sp. G11-34]MCZ2257585.1 S-layer homology domain-containing protein [Sporosarcina sp. G11-34]